MTGDTAAETAAHWKQWIIGADVRGRPVLPKHDFGGPKDRSYNLKNSKVRKFLQWERQTFGINLGWTDDAEPETGRKVARWFFARAGNSNEPIKYGESIAIGNGNGNCSARCGELVEGERRAADLPGVEASDGSV